VNYLIAFSISMLYVGLRSTQQISVTNKRYAWIPPVSMLMAISDFYMINLIVDSTMSIALAIGLGGASGACTSVFLIDRHFKRKEKQACQQ